MIFFFATVTVIMPAMVLMGVVAFAAHDARERCHAQPSRDKRPSRERS
jgi:hypothetical protein